MAGNTRNEDAFFPAIFCTIMAKIRIRPIALESPIPDVTKRNQLVTNLIHSDMPLPRGNILSLVRGWLPRCRVALLGIALIFLIPFSQAQAPSATPLRFGITGAILQEQRQLLSDWSSYLATHIGRPVEFVSRDRYTDTLDMLAHDQLEAAWVSDSPYILIRNQVRLVAVPVYHGRPLYRAYLIVQARDKATRSILQLRGTVFAYADTISHTGYLIPRYELAQAGEKPSTFFRKTFFTWGHRNSVEAVAQGLADASYVDSYVWDSMQKIAPNVTNQTRIVSRSDEFPFPPIVANRSISSEDYLRLQKTLFRMSDDPAGRQLLSRLNLDGFTQGRPENYDPVEKMMRAVGDK
ncbi:MAG: PhnD/SsuA/transferrin family substrate-binding protein [Rhodocyclaceae bacterium]|nr:PhnD/SsuA/transferrin family substrate-binding protein [Rhodocyclaceae bacterium]